MDDAARTPARSPARTLAFAALILFALLLFRQALDPANVLLPAESLYGFPPWSGYQSAGPWIEFDLVLLFYPWQHLIHQAWRQGVIPLWNPHIFCGAPLLAASQPAPFHPLNLLSQCFDPAHAFNFLLPARTLLAASGALALMLNLGASPPAALVSALAFGFGGGMIHFAGKSNPAVMGMLPWLLLASLRLCRRPGPRSAALLGLAIACMYLGGHIESAFYVTLFAGSFILWRCWASAPCARRRRLGWFAASLLPGLLLPALQGLPFLEYMAHSNALFDRQRGIGGLPGFPLARVPHLLLPDVWGDPFTGTFTPGNFAYNELTSAFIGLAPLLLAALALKPARLPGLRRFLGIWTLLAFIGVYEVPFASALLRALPGFSLSYNIRMILILHFSLSLLAGWGAERLVRERARVSARLLIGTAGVLGAAAAALASPGLRAAAGLKQAGGVSWIGGFCTAIACLLLLLFRIDGKRAAGWLCAAAAAASLFPFSWRANAASPRQRLFPETPGIAAMLQAAGAGRTAGIGRALFPNAGILFSLSDIRGYDSLVPLRIMRLLERIDPSLQQRPLDHVCQFVVLGQLRKPLLDLLGVRALMLPREAAPLIAGLIQQGWRQEYGGDSAVLSNPAARPRAEWVAAEPLPDDEAALGALSAPDYDPTGRAFVSGLPARIPAAAGQVLSITDPTPQRVVIEVESETPGFLRLSDTAFPGWTAEIDGQAAPWVTADYALRGLSAPAGRRLIEFRYQPFSFRLGLFLSLTGLAGLLAFGAGGRRRPAAGDAAR